MRIVISELEKKSNQFNNQIDSLTKDNIEIRRQLEK